MKVSKIIFGLILLWIEVASVSAQFETRSYPEGDALAGTRFENLLQTFIILLISNGLLLLLRK
jgi:hypothetical protein